MHGDRVSFQNWEEIVPLIDEPVENEAASHPRHARQGRVRATEPEPPRLNATEKTQQVVVVDLVVRKRR